MEGGEKYFDFSLMFFSPGPMLEKSHILRQITDEGYVCNEVYGNETV
jgi:hypothetical protein